jgi:hypothetical protein
VRRPGGTLALALAVAALAWHGARADEELAMRAPPLLVNLGLGFGIEPHTRQSVQCSRTSAAQGGGMQEVTVPQCNMVLAFTVGGEALWRGLVGPAVELVAAQGAAVQPGADASNNPISGYGDRISVVVAAAVRPFAWLAWAHSGWWRRLAAGFGLQVGVSVEYTRVTLDSQTNAGLHLGALLDVPVWRSNVEGGLSLRLSMRALISPEAVFPMGTTTVDEPGKAIQLFGGIAYYL